MNEVNIHHVSFHLKEPHDFGWLTELGEVFKVFDQQDSGNLSFGVNDHGTKKFIKYAGARTVNFKGEPVEAIQTLKEAVTVYQDLNHPHLVSLLDHFALPDGCVAVFDWIEGENLHPHWSFPPPAKYTDPRSPYYKYRQLPVEQRLASLEQIFAFHVHVIQKGYVAIDFYDGSIVYDFKANETKICDIDLYRRRPFINNMGRMWGSSRFMSPEEFSQGEELDEITNVFNMGATAFALLGGELDRAFSKWEAGADLYEVALKAVDPERGNRYPNLDEFVRAWNTARERERGME